MRTNSIDAFTVVTPHHPEVPSFEHLIQQIVDEWPIDQKIALVESLVSSSKSGMEMDLDNPLVSDSALVQINTMDREDMADILASISHRIKEEGR